MKAVRSFLVAVVAGGLMLIAAPSGQAAQLSISIGTAPVCPYGYYGYAPYNCAPYGYYGPQWFQGGVFIGAGRWFHGPKNFHGTVDNHYDPHHGYKGAMPKRGEHADAQHQPGHGTFHGNEERDGRGHTVNSHSSSHGGSGGSHNNNDHNSH